MLGTIEPTVVINVNRRQRMVCVRFVMSEGHQADEEAAKRERIVKNLDSMVESGRVTETEAAHLREAPLPVAFERAIRDIRVRHAASKLDAAVEAGEMSTQDAEAILVRLRKGEHSGALRARLRALPHVARA